MRASRLASAVIVGLPLAFGINLLKPTPAMAAKSCSDLTEGKCTIQLSTGITMAYVETGPESGTPLNSHPRVHRHCSLLVILHAGSS